MHASDVHTAADALRGENPTQVLDDVQIIVDGGDADAQSSPNEQTVKFRLAGVVRKLTERTWRASRSSKVTRPRFETVVVVSRSAMNRASVQHQVLGRGGRQARSTDSFPAQSCGSYAIRALATGGMAELLLHMAGDVGQRLIGQQSTHTVAVRGAGGGLLAVAGCVWACCGSFSRSPHRLRFRPACTPRKSCRRSCARSPT